jgi:predicted DNA-binding transcriptional regulator AlpA
MSTINELKILTIEELSGILKMEVGTIRTLSSKSPEYLPPRFKMPGRGKLLWLEQDVIEWINNCRTNKTIEDK